MRAARAAVRAVLIVAVLVVGLPAAGMSSAAADPAAPVVLVHGFAGSSRDMEMLRSALLAEGHPVSSIDLPGSENRANAAAIGREVERLRASHGGHRVAIVAHSMGGLSSRYYLQKLGGAQAVETYVSMGTAHSGYRPVCGLPVALAGQMCPEHPFMQELATGDPSPGDARYTTLTSSKDESRDQRLPGAACHREIEGVEHPDEPRSPAFIAAVRTALGGRCP